jgi:hypothetical protein
MPFVTKNPAHYFSALAEDSTDPLKIGLFFSGYMSDTNSSALVKLASAIKTTTRSIRCLWLRFQDDVDEVTMSSFRLFGQMIVGTKAIESIVLEGNGVGLEQIVCLQEYLSTNKTLRGINFTDTMLDRSSSMLLYAFLSGNSALRVLDLTSNSRVDDDSITALLTALSEGGSNNLSTLNICEANFDGVEDVIGDNGSITTIGVRTIINRFIAQTPSLITICLKMRSLNDELIHDLSNIIREEDCKISRLEISGTFGDNGLQSIAEALKTNRSLRFIDIGNSVNLTDSGGRAILSVTCVDVNSSWKCIMASNNTLKSVCLKSRLPPLLISQDIQHALRNITSLDPLPTLQQKVWQFVDNNIEDLSYTKLNAKHMPFLLSFVITRGGMNALLRLISSRSNIPMLFSHPTPERLHMEAIMNKIALENATLRAMLKSERLFNDNLCKENNSLRTLHEGDIADDETTVATTVVTPLLPQEEGHRRRCLCCKRGPTSKLWKWC